MTTKTAAYAATTKTSAQSTQAEIERLLRKHDVEHFGYMTQPGLAVMVFSTGPANYRISVPIPDRRDRSYDLSPSGRRRDAQAKESAWEQDVRSRWRVLLLVIKAKLELAALWRVGIDEALVEYQQLADGRTVSEAVRQDGMTPPALRWN